MKKAFPWLRNKRGLLSNGGVTLRGEKVIIREKRLEDVDCDYAWRTDEGLSRLDATRPVSMSYKDFLRYSREEMAYGTFSSHRLAIDTLNGQHIGNCMYYDIDTKLRQAELGIMIGDRGYWGKGYGTDSVVLLLHHIFTATPLTRIYLHTLDWNHRAMRSFSKAGFREVNNVRRSGLEFVQMEITKADWQGRRDNRGKRLPTVKEKPQQIDRNKK